MTVSGQAPPQPTGTLTSPNLVYSTANPLQVPAGTTPPYTWSGFTVTESTGGGLSGGNQPGYNVSTGHFMFGYTQSTIAYNYALSTALKNSGMTWLGYNYAWEYYNQDLARGTLTANVTFNAVNGTVLHNKNWTLGKTTEGWTAMSGTETFTNPLAVANIHSFDLTFDGKDDRFWAGFYGPMVRKPSISVLYTFDACSSNPLSSTTCPGYAEAYKTQQCTANPLYDPSCPGYAVAYQTQQCSANPLYAVTCPGYAAAYKTQQCTLDPLYDKTCSGYEAAYKTQQCTANALYATDCPGYAAAYKTQQCSLNSLYATDCPGYQQAYLNQQCSLNSLYDRTCPGYNEAYAKANLLTTNTTTTTTTTTAVPTTETTTQLTSGVKDSTTSSVIAASKETTSATSPTSIISPISVIAPPKAPAVESAITSVSITVPPTPEQQQERQQDQKKTDSAVATVERRAGNDKKEVGRQVAVAAREAVEKAQKADTLEAQAANQGMAVGLMGYVPGFSAYQNAIVPDVLATTVARQYMKPTVDNRAAQRALTGASDKLHQQMVDLQYAR